jgi:hypothetical protein
MTDEQFEKLYGVLTEINTNIKRLMGAPDAKNQYDLSDVWSAVDDVAGKVDGVDSSISDVKNTLSSISNAVDRLG